ncbi:MAG TPA: S9 family peptidase, partial [Kiloniellaceae bacterium]|nr:S9 family peptidase [Kiloniellaceae bacterium]
MRHKAARQAVQKPAKTSGWPGRSRRADPGWSGPSGRTEGRAAQVGLTQDNGENRKVPPKDTQAPKNDQSGDSESGDNESGPLSAPVAPRHPKQITLHGIVREDPYAWLRADNWREVMTDPAALGSEIRAYLEAENAFTKKGMASTEALQKTLFNEMKARLKEDDSSVPSPDGAFAYYHRFEIGGQHPLFCRKAADSEMEEVLLDGNREAEGETFFRVASCEHSPDHRFLAYATDRNGSEQYVINVKDLETGTQLKESITGAQGSLAWANDGRTLFYVTLDAEHRPSKVFRHRLGSDPAEDVLVYAEPDPGFF